MKTIVSRSCHLLACACAVTVLGGCAAYSGTVSVSSTPVHPAPAARHYDIPAGHMPPPGSCRIWFPDRPPGRQPPPGNCYDLQQKVPPGAILVRG